MIKKPLLQLCYRTKEALAPWLTSRDLLHSDNNQMGSIRGHLLDLYLPGSKIKMKEEHKKEG